MRGLRRLGWLASFLVGFVPTAGAQTLRNVADGTANSLAMDTDEATVSLNRLASVVSDAVAEISPNEVKMRSTGNAFVYDIVPTIGAGDTGPVAVEITTPPGYTALSVSEVLVGGIPLAESCPNPVTGQYCVTISGQVITIALGERITASGTAIQVRFAADAPSVAGTADFTSALRDSSLTRTARAGDADGDPTDANSTAVEVSSSQGALLLSLTADRDQVVVGEPINYLVEIRNQVDQDVTDVRVDDTLPPDFKYVAGSAQLNGAAIGDPAQARPLRFPIGTMPARVDANGNGATDAGETGYAALTFQAVVGAGARPGEYRSSAVATDFCDTCAISNEVQHEVDVRLDELLDLGLVIGKVFEDRDRDGAQDSGEPGVAKALVALDDGTIAITDEHGRYHVPAVVPGQRMIKLDLASLGGGAVATTDSSRILTVTPGIAARANFGVALVRDSETIGTPAEPGVAITGEAQHLPIQVLGSAETLAVLVNGDQIVLPTGNVRLTAGELDEVVHVSDDGLTEPITFQLDLDFRKEVARWSLHVMDGREEIVHSAEGAGDLPASLAWDGRTDAGRLLEAGEIYHYRLDVVTREGIRWSSGNRYFGVNRRSFIAVRLTGDSFASNTAVLSAKAQGTLREAGAVIQRFPDQKVVIEGHTDSRGSSEHNMDLSRRRAEAALRFLTNEVGLPEDQFALQWFGEERPIASEAEPGGAAQNRRIVIRAQMEEIERARAKDAFWTEANVEVNGRPVPTDVNGRFSAVLDGESTEVDMAVTSAEGRTASARIGLPALEILEPVGEHRIPYGASREGFTVSARGEAGPAATASVAGRTDPGAVVEIGGVVVPTAPDGTFATVVDLASGRNGFGIVARSPSGFRRIVNLDVQVSERDEEGEILIETDVIPNLTVYWPPSDGPLRTLELRLEGTTDPENEIRVNGEPWEVRPDGSFGDRVEMRVGACPVSVGVTDPQGRTGSLERTYQVAESQLFLVALADGVVGQLHGDGNLEGAGLEEASELYATGRISYYMKGLVRGKYLVKSAFDSGHRDIEPIFGNLDEAETERLLRNLDPDKFYPVYGDESTVVWDAETRGRFYLAIDAAEWSVLVGDYPVAWTDTELGAYQRTLYGGKAVWQRARRGEDGPPDTQVLVFGAELEQIHVRDEVGATGGSLYFLSHEDLVEGSEQVAIVVRDKITGLVLSRRTQQRNVDYSVKYEEGRVLFHRPISSVVLDDLVVDPEILSGNPVSIEFDYETLTESFEETAAGVRAKQRLGDELTVGGTFVDDHPDAGAYQLGGVDAEVKAAGSRLVAEWAQSEGTNALTFVSQDGGLSYTAAEGSSGIDGSAWRTAAELDVGRWWGEEGRLRVKGYHKELDSGFVSAGNFLDRGTSRTGGSASFRLDGANTFVVSHDREDRTGAAGPAGLLDEAATTTAEWNHLRERWGLDVEYFSSGSKDAFGTTIGESQLAAAEAVVRLRDDFTGRAEYQQTMSGDRNNQLTLGAEYRTLEHLALEARGTVGSLGSSAQAGAVLTTGDTRVYLAERLVEDDAGHAASTVVGAESRLGPDTKVYSEYQREAASAGERNVALIGLSRELRPVDDVTLAVSAEHSNVDSGSADRKRSAVTGRLAYDARGLRALTSNEYRIEDGAGRSQQFLTSNHVDVKVAPDYTVLGKYRYSRTSDRETNAEQARLEEASIGLAYRPVAGDRVNGLTRYTHLQDRRPTLTGGEPPTRRKLDVLSLDTIVDVHPRVEWVTKGAARVRTERSGDSSTLTTHTYLAVQRLNGNVWGPFDLGLEYRILAQEETDGREQGWLTDVMWKLHSNFRIGAGFNFTDFSDNEFTMNDYSVGGWFLRAQGRY
jgi:uncharacterized repeat protein (TIGR01451 family)